jgi:hypothetical protein
MVLIRKYGHWSMELKKTTMDIVSLSKGLLLYTSVRYCGAFDVGRPCSRMADRWAELGIVLCGLEFPGKLTAGTGP